MILHKNFTCECMIYIQTRETQENVLLTPLTFIGTDDFSFLFGHWIHAMGVQNTSQVSSNLEKQLGRHNYVRYK